MEMPIYCNQADFTSQVQRLVNQSAKFIDSMKPIKPMQSGVTGLLEHSKKLVATADVSNVSSIGVDLDDLDAQLFTLLKKFYVIQSSHHRDATLKNFLGDFTKSPSDAYAKLVGYSDGCIQQIDAVITAYSKIERGITKSGLWIKHMLSNYTPKQTQQKAEEAQKIIIDLSKIVSKIRDTSHDTKLELLNIRNLAVKYSAPQTPRQRAQTFPASAQ